jgi:hypothetical protein
LTGDDPGQARTLFEDETVFLSKTVLLESEWVLRRLYGFAADRLASFDDRLVKRARRIVDVRVVAA